MTGTSLSRRRLIEMATFYGYVHVIGRKVDFEVVSRIRTWTCGHYTYVLKGLYAEDGRIYKCASFVNKDQWDRYGDVPVVDKAVEKKAGAKYRSDRKRSLLGKPSRRKGKRVYDEEIEQWLLDHCDMDFNALDDNRITEE